MLLTAALGVGVPTSALAKGGPRGGPGRGLAVHADCHAVQAVAGAHQKWLTEFPVLAARLAACRGGGGTPQGRAAPGRDQFDDLQGFAWAAPDISLLAQLGVVQGEGNGSFAPAGPITRADFAALLQRLFRLPEPPTPVTFTDVPSTYWAYAAVEAAAPYMTEFTTPGGVAFEPSLPLVRIEVAATIGEIEVAEHLASLPSAAQAAQIWAQFSDGGQVPPGLAQAAALSVQLGLMKGLPGGSFGVEGTLTRAEAAVLLARVLQGSEVIGTAPVPAQGVAPAVAAVSPASGPSGGGTSVVVSGSGFVPGASVYFGGAAATNVTYDSSSVLVAVSPAGIGTVNITVRENGTTSTTSTADLFAYTGTQGVPAVTGILPASGAAAGGTTVAVTGAGFASGATVLFGANPATSVTYVNSGLLEAVSPAGASTVDVRVAQAGGTSPTTVADQFTYTTTAQAVPVVTAVSPNGGPAAGGTTVVVSGSQFTNDASVLFGATRASSVTYVNSSTLDAVSPAGTDTVDVLVTQAGGTSTITTADRFTYGQPAAAVTITAISPASGTSGGGTTVTISGTGFAQGATVYFGTTAATNVTVEGSTAITATTPAGAGTVQVSVVQGGQTYESPSVLYAYT